MAIKLADAVIKIRADNSVMRRDFFRIENQAERAIFAITAAASVASGMIAAVSAGILTRSLGLAASLEETRVAFTSLLGDAERANKLIEELREFARKTPFGFEGAKDEAKRLLAAGIAADELLETMTFLGNASAATGTELQRLAINFGQVRANLRLTGRELRDFTLAGVPIREELARVMGVGVSAIEGLVRKGKISFEVVKAAFESMSAPGGAFFDFMIERTKTFIGTLDILKDALQDIGRDLGEMLLPMAKRVVVAMVRVADSVREFIKVTKQLVPRVLISTAVVSALTAAVGALIVTLRLAGVTLFQVLAGGVIGAAFVAAGVAAGFLAHEIMKSKEAVDKFKMAWMHVRAVFEHIMRLIMLFIRDMLDAFNGFLVKAAQWVSEFVLDAAEWFHILVSQWETVWALMRVQFEITKQAVKDLTRRILWYFRRLFTGVGDQASYLLEVFVWIWEALKKGISTTMAFMESQVLVFIQNVAPRLGHAFIATFEKIGEAIILSVHAWKEGFINSIMDLLNELAPLLRKWSLTFLVPIDPFVAQKRNELEKQIKEVMGKTAEIGIRNYKRSFGVRFKGFDIFGVTLQEVEDRIKRIQAELERAKNTPLPAFPKMPGFPGAAPPHLGLELHRRQLIDRLMQEKRTWEAMRRFMLPQPRDAEDVGKKIGRNAAAAFGSTAEPLLKAGRHGFAEFGRAIQDALLEDKDEQLDVLKDIRDQIADLNGNFQGRRLAGLAGGRR